MEIRLARHGRHVAIVTIDNQRRLNAMTRQMLGELGRLWDELEQDECRCIVLTGAGERAFTVGADISGDLSAGPEIARMVNHALLKNEPYSKPIIAAVNGDCVGGGLELMLSTDIRVAAPTARFGLTEVKWSIYPFGGSTIKLIQQIGYVHAMDLLLTARLIDAAQAAQLGLVNRLVPPDELMGWAIETAEMIAANSPSAVQAVKRQVSATIADHALTRESMEQQQFRMRPAVARRLMTFGAGFPPLDRRSQLAGQIGAEQFLGVEVHFCPKTTTDIRRHHAQQVLRDAHCFGDPAPVHMRHLTGHINRQPAIGARLGENGAGFEAGRNEPVVEEA
jgi:enoyl-CoA hydratase/carnithine racemase